MSKDIHFPTVPVFKGGIKTEEDFKVFKDFTRKLRINKSKYIDTMIDKFMSIVDKKSYYDFIDYFRKDIIKIMDIIEHINLPVSGIQYNMKYVECDLPILNMFVRKYVTLQDSSNKVLAGVIYDKEKDNILKIYTLLEKYYSMDLFPTVSSLSKYKKIKDVVITKDEFNSLNKLLFDYGVLELEFDSIKYSMSAIGLAFYDYIIPIIFRKDNYSTLMSKYL